MFDIEELKQRDEDLQRSEAVVHYKGEQDLTAEKRPEDYKPHWSEQNEQTRPREMLSMGNSYGNISVGANRNREMLLTVSQRRQHNSETLNNDQKKLNGPRRRSVPDAVGWAYTNSSDSINSAFAFKTRKLQPTKRLLASINKYIDKNGQNTVETILPFLALEKDKKRLQALTNEIVDTRQAGKDFTILEHEREHLSQAVFRKEQMQSRFLKKMQFAVQKARVVTSEEPMAWLNTAIFTEGLDTADMPPTDEEEGLLEGLLDAFKDKAPGSKE
jgi:hypothetical protein